MAFENMDDLEPGLEEVGPPPEESSNRPFLLVAGILGAIMLASLLCLAAFAAFRFPAIQNQRATEAAQAMEQSTRVALAALAVDQTAQAQAWTPTFTPTKPATATPVPDTPTPVLAQVFTNTPTSGPDPRTATVAALLTQAAAAQTEVTGPTATALPAGGFADDVGAPGMLALAVLLVGVIFLARRVRTAH